jgi:hypothetical protein
MQPLLVTTVWVVSPVSILADLSSAAFSRLSPLLSPPGQATVLSRCPEGPRRLGRESISEYVAFSVWRSSYISSYCISRTRLRGSRSPRRAESSVASSARRSLHSLHPHRERWRCVTASVCPRECRRPACHLFPLLFRGTAHN